ncbi:MAG: MFS transporter [Gloeotrichia echinulata GP01]
MIELKEDSNLQKESDMLSVIREMRHFLLIWFGQLVSVSGSGLTNFALDIWVYERTGSVTQFALLILCNTLPFVLISPLSGILVDRWNRRWLMICSDFCAGLCTLSIAWLYASDRLEIWHIYIITSAISAFAGIQWPSYNASITLLVPQKHLARANALNQLTDACARLVAPILAAILLGVIELKGIIIIDFATMLIALIPLLFLRFPEVNTKATEKEEASASGPSSFFLEVSQGLIYLWERPGLFAVVLLMAVTNFLTGVFDIVAIPLALSLSSVAITGTVFSISCSGLIVGGIAMSIWGELRRYINIILISTTLAGLFIAIAGLRSSLLVFTPAAFLFFLVVPVINSSSLAILQKKVVPNVQGRVFALQGAIATTCLSLGYITAGTLSDQVFEPLMADNGMLAGSIGQIIGVGTGRGMGLLLIVVGILTMLLSAIAYLYPRLRSVEEELPDTIPDQTSPLIEKWDGPFPTVMDDNGAVPLININPSSFAKTENNP